MSRSRDLANLGDEATGGITVSDISDISSTYLTQSSASSTYQTVTNSDKLAHQSVPHIIPRYLHPAIEGKSNTGVDLKALVTAGSYTWGDVYSGDDLRYFYTDIKGSRKIHDPRVGAYFGSQRHKFKSLQLLEQETATHGKDVYSVDGREWIRAVQEDTLAINNDGHGNYIALKDEDYVEIVGYFNDANFSTYTFSGNTFEYKIDGGSFTNGDYGATTETTPLGSRFLDASSFINLGISESLGIHTLRIKYDAGGTSKIYAVELIAHDTSNVNEIKIPKQNVVSYGKKFEIGSDTLGDAVHPHYNPFNNQTIGDNESHGKNTSGWTTYDSTLHEASSLGLDAWKDGSNYYRPVNGGRIIKWVDENGNIKTSVNMMPPSAKAIGSHSGDSGPHETPWTSAYQPIFSSGSIDHTQAEVAKTWHWREFGNGAGNEGSTTSGTKQDASMVLADNDIAYVMDDGLSSLSAKARVNSNPLNGGTLRHRNSTDGEGFYFTFIGTGVSYTGRPYYRDDNFHHNELVENLPYGTHIVAMLTASGTNATDIIVDGVTVRTTVDETDEWRGGIHELMFHQPKKPPIPEDAVVLCDYMLMADFVGFPDNTAGSANIIGKGVRRVNASRDVTYPEGGTFQQDHQADTVGGFRILSNSSGFNFNLPYFGTNPTFIGGSYTDRSTANQFKVNDTLVTTSSSGTNHSGTQVLTSWTSGSNGFSTDNDGSFTLYNSSLEPAWATVTGINLGVNKVSIHNGSSDWLIANAFDVATPIHSSSHYQPFESPFLHELQGGDRNMEQTNLIVSPDGRTWDEVTRDTSYLGNVACQMNTDNPTNWDAVVVFDEWRGANNAQTWFNKYFAIAYDRLICLETGWYKFIAQTASDSANAYMTWRKNTQTGMYAFQDGDASHMNLVQIHHCQRGDYIQLIGEFGNQSNLTYNNASVEKLS